MQFIHASKTVFSTWKYNLIHSEFSCNGRPRSDNKSCIVVRFPYLAIFDLKETSANFISLFFINCVELNYSYNQKAMKYMTCNCFQLSVFWEIIRHLVLFSKLLSFNCMVFKRIECVQIMWNKFNESSSKGILQWEINLFYYVSVSSSKPSLKSAIETSITAISQYRFDEINCLPIAAKIRFYCVKGLIYLKSNPWLL